MTLSSARGAPYLNGWLRAITISILHAFNNQVTYIMCVWKCNIYVCDCSSFNEVILVGNEA